MSSTIRSVISGSSDDLEELADEPLSFSPQDVDHYAVRVYRDGTQGAGNVEGFEELERPIEKEPFEEVVEHDGLERGTYKLYAIGGENQRLLGAIWSLEAGERPSEEADDLEKRLDRLERRQEERETIRIETPDQAFAALAERMIEEDETALEADLLKLADILFEWKRIETPLGPEFYAGRIMDELIEDGNSEAALRLLDVWFQYDAQGESERSLVEIAQDVDDLDLSMDSVLGIGALKALDNPGKFTRAAAGALENVEQSQG